ncbi:MAG: hypothetical protein LBO75_02155 [Bifidobacteriaceae bacterium]|nr:hypothetical protein [Bifidobacteriaceae bacterium]
MPRIQFLAESSGLEQLVDLASFPNLVQIGAILAVLALVGLGVLISLSSTIKRLKAQVTQVEVATQFAPTAWKASAEPGVPGAPATQLAPVAPAGQPFSAIPKPQRATTNPDGGFVSFADLVAGPSVADFPAVKAPFSAAEPFVAADPFATGDPFAPVEPGASPLESAVQPAAPVTQGSELSQAVPVAINTTARREITLVGRAMKILDQLEQSETDPDKLFALFGLDNLMARIRRGAEAQMILAGRDPERSIREPLTMSDVVRTAASQIEYYERVKIAVEWDPMIRAYAVVPLAHLVAELLENAAAFSPEGAVVEVSGSNQQGDLVLAVVDNGVGMAPEELTWANQVLQAGPSPEDLARGRLGVAVVSRLAARLGVTVSFAPVPGENASGTAATVRVPSQLLDDRPPEQGRRAPGGEEPVLAPQPQLDAAVASEGSTSDPAFQPLHLVPEGGTELPQRRGKGTPSAAETPVAPGLVATPENVLPETELGPVEPGTGDLAAASAEPASAESTPAAAAVPPNRRRAGGARLEPSAESLLPPAGTETMVPLGARFSPLGEGTSQTPAAPVPRHSASPQEVAPSDWPSPAALQPSEVLHTSSAPSRRSSTDTSPDPLGLSDPLGAARETGELGPLTGTFEGPITWSVGEAKPAIRPGRPAHVTADLPALSEALASGSPSPAPGQQAPRRLSTAARRPALPSRQGLPRRSESTTPGLAPVPFSEAPPNPVAFNTAAPNPVPPLNPAASPPVLASPNPVPPNPSVTSTATNPRVAPVFTPAPPVLPGNGPGNGPAASAAYPGTVAPPLNGTPPGAIPPAAGFNSPLSMAPPAGFAPPPGALPPPPAGGTFQPGGSPSGVPAPDFNGSIAGSAFALKASIQEEALAELAGINTYKPERVESKPASGLARRQTGVSALPTPPQPPAAPTKTRDANKVRSAFSAFQRGTKRGRSGPGAGAGEAER